MASITLTFTAPNPVPALGYVVRYREVGTTTWNYVNPNPTASPIVITGLPEGKSWEGEIASQCDSETQSAFIPWSINDVAEICTTVRLNSIEDVVGAVNVTYVDCEGVAQSINLGPMDEVYVCGMRDSFVAEFPEQVTITEVALNCSIEAFDYASYEAGGDGGITGTCNFVSTTATRSQAAADASSNSNVRIKATFRYTSDGLSGSGFVDHEYIFEIGSLMANEHPAVDLSVNGACSQIFVDIINIEAIP